MKMVKKLYWKVRTTFPIVVKTKKEGEELASYLDDLFDNNISYIIWVEKG